MEQGKQKWRALRRGLAVWLATGLVCLAPVTVMRLQGRYLAGWPAIPAAALLLAGAGALLYASVCAVARTWVAHPNKRFDWLRNWLFDYRMLTAAAMLGMFAPVFVIMLVIMGGLRDMWFVLLLIVGIAVLCGSCTHTLHKAKHDAEILEYLKSLQMRVR